jgi:hypothetical protein
MRKTEGGAPISAPARLRRRRHLAFLANPGGDRLGEAWAATLGVIVEYTWWLSSLRKVKYGHRDLETNRSFFKNLVMFGKLMHARCFRAVLSVILAGVHNAFTP